MRILFLILFTTCSIGPTFANDLFHQDLEKLLIQLDDLIHNNVLYEKQKNDRLEILKNSITHEISESNYWRSKDVYQEYRSYDSDSAMVWLEKLEGLAQRLTIQEELIFNKIEHSYLLAATGLLFESQKEIETIKLEKIPEKYKVAYYTQMTYLYSHLQQYWVGCRSFDATEKEFSNQSLIYQEKYKIYLDSLQSIIPVNETENLWSRAWKYRDTDSIKNIREELVQVLSDKDFTTPQEAKLLYALSHLYAQINDRVGMMNALIYSAMADIRCANREIASLQELSRHLYNHNNIDRAYSYISLCLRNAQIYQSRIRAMEIAGIMDVIYVKNMERNHMREEKLNQSLVGLILVILLVIVLLFVITYQFVRIQKSHEAVRSANHQLNEHVQALTEAQAELSALNIRLTGVNAEVTEANAVKEEYIGYIFKICSDYIGKIANNHKMISRKLKTGQVEEVIKLTDSATFLNNEMKSFYQQFDAIFLKLYPDFVLEFNKLLRSEDQIHLKKNELLNTELRIYALVRLGITDSNKIAEFLHMSPQTIYNNRVKVRNRSILPKEDFDLMVRKLGNFRFTGFNE